ncbi:Ferredoxin--nitrite reductase [Sulfurimonas denitrificans DSM 1251]|uniref:Ferredoxin--nitrite reductase n=1 Tax=Sulfurimonas denitrificans (strain ATCC 33889 / DSM 1251) TaxID=326298 RepID=Q30R62_SULDN|nr:ferredoxin--nitrite reductase [Sulfurimonas denitrificans]ABB44519.1 Ferredoxin--nitrite reductase [Sulfurimonas denitrificans DSM 1251]MDD3441702.1 nitrite/sulfite reductase [Sulfurimonas denitrificans]
MENKLNKRERYKAQLKPIDYYKDFENIDFESLTEIDRFYLQDFGIFNTNFLEDEFTVRIRIPGGKISAENFQKIADIVDEYNLTIILTARSGIQLHNVEADNVLEIHKRINALGVSTWQSFGDNVRNIITDAYDGCGSSSEIETYPIVMAMHNFIIENPRYVGMLPRRISVGISGNRSNVSSFFANDIYFALAKKNGLFGFNVYMGGKNTEVAISADIFLLEAEVLGFFKAFIESFYVNGSRSSRAKTRIFHMIEEIGMEALKAFIQQEYKSDFQTAGELILEKTKFEAFHKLKNGKYGFCYQTDFSRLKTDEIKNIAAYATVNSLEIRLGMDQNIYLIGLNEPSTPLKSQALSSTIVACAGNLCPYAVWSIKDETSYLPLEKINKHGIQVGFSGCAKGCGRHRHTDIGLIGLKTNNFGNTDGGARIFIGASHSDGAYAGRQLFSMVPFIHLESVISLAIKFFELSTCSDFEEFATKVLNNYSEEFVSLWFLANLETNKCIELLKQDSTTTYEYEKELLKKEFGELDFWEHVDENFHDAISYLSKELWTIEGEDPHYKPKIERVNFR